MRKEKKLIINLTSFLIGKKIRDLNRETRQLRIATRKRVDESLNRYGKKLN